MAAPDAEIEKPLGGATKMGKVPKMAKVKNKAPADLQITAEQLLREAKERELEIVPAPPKQKIQDEEELRDFQMRKRKNFEDAIRKNRSVISNWIKYAVWEEAQGALERARLVPCFFVWTNFNSIANNTTEAGTRPPKTMIISSDFVNVFSYCNL